MEWEINQEMVCNDGDWWEWELIWHHWTVKELLSLLILFPRQKKYRKKKKREKLHIATEQILTGWLPWRRGEWGEEGGCGWSCWGRKAKWKWNPKDGEKSLLSFLIQPSSMLLIWCSGGKITCISSCLASHKKTSASSSVLSCTLCLKAYMYHSSADKLPPPASFFTRTLTQNPPVHSLVITRTISESLRNDRWGSRARGQVGGVWWRTQVAANIASFSFWQTGRDRIYLW